MTWIIKGKTDEKQAKVIKCQIKGKSSKRSDSKYIVLCVDIRPYFYIFIYPRENLTWGGCGGWRAEVLTGHLCACELSAHTEHVHSQNQPGGVQHCDTLHLTVLTGWRRGEASLWWYEGEFPSVLRKGRSLGRADVIMEKEAGWERRKEEYKRVHVIMHVNMLI